MRTLDPLAFLRLTVALGGLGAVLAPSPAAARDAATEALRLSGWDGLAGMGELVDARVPEQWVGRGGLRFVARREEREYRGATSLDRVEELNELRFFGGASLGAFELGGHIALRGLRTELDFTQRGDRSADELAHGDLGLAFKATLVDLDWIQAAPYARGLLPVAADEVELPGRLEYGVATTCALGFWRASQEHLAFHLNLAGAHEEDGVSSFVYRLGLSLSFAPERNLLLRVHLSGAGEEFEGRPTSTLQVGGGIQLLAWRQLSFELGASVQVAEGGLRPGRVRHDLERSGVQERHEDGRAIAAHVAIGFAF